jgi:hypothetical protein
VTLAGVIGGAETVAPWLALAIRLPALRRRTGDALLQAWCVAVLAVAVTFTIFSPPVYLSIDRVARLPNLSQLLGNEAAVVGGTALLVFLAHVNRPELPRWRQSWHLWLVGLGVVLLLAALFLRIPSRPDQPDYWSHYAALPGVAVYRLVWLLYLGFVAFNLTRLSLRYARMSLRPVIRLGVRAIAAGGALGCLDVLDESARVLGPLLGIHWLGPLTNSRTLSTATVILCVAGDTLPSWGPRLGVDAALGWVEEHRSLRRLYPLWLMLCELVPTVALVPPRGRLMDALNVRDVHFRLYRRVVEIRDAVVLLASDVHARDGAPELAALVVALRAESAMIDGSPPDSGPGGFQAEVRALERLASAPRR